ncbi:oxidoreductase [Nocardia sp. NBC_01388]|uniref:oxidoreductase n=1 Tax=Nocardia sp. NBC_01388 TaxID=2903596 RepID=UPI003251C11C
MSFLDFLGRSVASNRGADPADAAHLAEWTRTHRGVEAFVEPRTTVTDVTVVLVAFDGEWTRRVVGERGAQKLSTTLGIPVYDVRKVGYPQRMRDHDARLRILRRRAREGY